MNMKAISHETLGCETGAMIPEDMSEKQEVVIEVTGVEQTRRKPLDE